MEDVSPDFLRLENGRPSKYFCWGHVDLEAFVNACWGYGDPELDSSHEVEFNGPCATPGYTYPLHPRHVYLIPDSKQLAWKSYTLEELDHMLKWEYDGPLKERTKGPKVLAATVADVATVLPLPQPIPTATLTAILRGENPISTGVLCSLVPMRANESGGKRR